MITLNFSECLQEWFSPKIKVDTTSVMEALKLVFTQYPRELQDKIPVSVEGYTTVELLEMHTNGVEVTIRKAEKPAYSGRGGQGGSSSSGWIMLAIGVALVVVAGPVGFAALQGTAMGSFILQVGIGLAISGLMQVLAPKPDDSNPKSRYFSGSNTTTEMGTPIQMVFGTHRAFGHLISFNIDARNYSGVDDVEKSPYFTKKADENIPTENLNKFYGVVKAGSVVKIAQDDNNVNKSGVQL